MEHKHTPGEWRISEDLNENLFGDAISVDVLDGQDFPIATVDATPIIHDWPRKFPNMDHWADGANDGRTQIERPAEQVVANARLIAAAPELLDGCKVALTYIEAVCFNTPNPKRRKNYADCASNLRAAIAKATGGQK